MTTQNWRFTSLDTWFFRESRPHERIGGTELASLFPPPARTLIGAVRTAIGEGRGVDWHRLKDDLATRAIIGFGDHDLGSLRFDGPWIHHAGTRYYPLPLTVLAKLKPEADPGKTPGYEMQRLALGPGCLCDLGEDVRMPTLPKDCDPGFKPLSPAWVNADGLRRILDGGVPDPAHLLEPDALFREEPRLGIARDYKQRTVLKSRLYQTRHLRLDAGTALEVGVTGLPADATPVPMIKLGGEGRLATIDIHPEAPSLPDPPEFHPGDGLLIYLLTPADFGTNDQNKPFGTLPTEVLEKGVTQQGAVIGKAHREGGWDLANDSPRPMRSFVPAGSVWFCTVGSAPAAVAKALHGTAIGNDTKLGRGRIAVGRWPAHENLMEKQQ